MTKTVTTAALPYVIMQVMLGIQNTNNQVLNTWQHPTLNKVLDPDF